jgi:hypothetical protein
MAGYSEGEGGLAARKHTFDAKAQRCEELSGSDVMISSASVPGGYLVMMYVNGSVNG